jgi:hypothetical protein
LRAVLGQLVQEAPTGLPPPFDPGVDPQDPPMLPSEQNGYDGPKLDWPWDLAGPVVPDRIRIRRHGCWGMVPYENPEFKDGIAEHGTNRPWPVRPLPAQWAEFWRLLRRCELHQLPNRHPYPDDWHSRPSEWPLLSREWLDAEWELGIDWGRYRLRQRVMWLAPAFWGDRFQQLRAALITLAGTDGFDFHPRRARPLIAGELDE